MIVGILTVICTVEGSTVPVSRLVTVSQDSLGFLSLSTTSIPFDTVQIDLRFTNFGQQAQNPRNPPNPPRNGPPPSRLHRKGP